MNYEFDVDGIRYIINSTGMIIKKTPITQKTSLTQTNKIESENKHTMKQNKTYEMANTQNRLQLVPFWVNENNDFKEIIGSFKEIVPEKVVVVYFADGQSEKMVCREPDVFNLHRCLYLAIAKHLYKQEYTTEGIEYKASELSMQKKYVKMVENAIKVHNRMLRDQEKAERLELERIAAKNRRLQKKQEKRAKTKDVKLEEAIEMHKEAYLRAMKEYKNDKKKEK